VKAQETGSRGQERRLLRQVAYLAERRKLVREVVDYRTMAEAAVPR
jgi:hypothetical protein